MVREKSIESFYSKLRESAIRSAGNTPLLIFPSTSDVDSLCALKIIGHVLESDSVRYACYPVSSFKEIHKYAGGGLSGGLGEDEAVTILLINWGCHRDLRKVLEIGQFARVFVVDSHRPIHLRNLSEMNERVVVLYTEDDEVQGDLRYGCDVKVLVDACDVDGVYEVEEEEDSDDDSDSDDEDGIGSRKRKRDSEDEDDPVKIFRKFKKEYYHMGTFHGKSSGCLMYKLSDLMRKSTNDLLWLACVALTDQFVHERLPNERYQEGVMELEEFILRLENLREVTTSVTLKDGTIICAPEASRIAHEDEPRLMLLQEWNLFDSMLCSSYMATKLKTWSDNGTKKLMLLLAQMGFALEECKQKFRYMSVEIKKKMKEEFDHYLPDYGLNDFYYRGFLLLHGYSSKISAADVVYGVTALLESSIDSNDSCAPKQFGEAYDALSLRKLDKLELGMRHAIKIQRAILRQGSSAITRKGSIRSGSKFRWVKLEDSADAKLLGYPQALTKFGYFLMDALREKGAKMKPLICVCYTEGREKVLIVAVCGKPRLGAVQGNAFGIAFRTAAEETGAEFFHELFESSWIILEAVAVNSFMIRLTEKLL
ncbi:cell division control protein 45 [Tanacetum coccineum]